jgi:hypothetical protein
MFKRKPFNLFFFIQLLVLFFNHHIFAQQPEDFLLQEDPETLFDAQIGDDQVRFELSGSWKLDMSYGLSWYQTDDVIFTSPISSLPYGFFFKQVPDLTFTATLENGLFAEYSILGGFDENQFSLGFRNPDSEVGLQQLRFGTLDNRLNAYGSLPQWSLDGRPSLYVSFINQNPGQQAGNLSEFLLSLDQSAGETRRFLGTRELQEYSLSIEQYAQNRVFMLPDRNISALNLYIEDLNGSISASGTSYRIMTSEEYTLIDDLGILILHQDIQGNLIVYYESSGFSVGNPSIGRNGLPAELAGFPDPAGGSTDFDFTIIPNYMGEDLSTRAIPLSDGNTGLLLASPGNFSPFAFTNAYAHPAFNLDNSFQFTSSDNEAVLGNGDPLFTVRFGDLILLSSNDEIVRENHLLKDISERIYGPNAETYPENIRFTLYKPGDDGGIVLPEDVIPETVEIEINGRVVRDFIISGNRVLISQPLAEDDILEIRYRYKESSANTSLFLGFGTLQQISQAEFFAALNSQWRFPQASYTQVDENSSGTTVITLGAQSIRDSYEISSEFQAGLTFTDLSNGKRFLSNLKDSSLSLAKLVPSSADISYPGINRSSLRVRDYFTYIPGSPPLLNDLSLSADLLSEGSGSPFGPYFALVDGRRVAVLESTIADGGWTGVQIANISNDPVSKVTVVFDADAGLSGTDIVLRIGKFSEDLDGDLILDVESGDSGLIFNYQGVDRRIFTYPNGSGNGFAEDEDANANGILDRYSFEQASQTVSYSGTETEITFYIADFNLSSPDLQIILDNNSGSTKSGRMWIKSILIESEGLGSNTSLKRTIKNVDSSFFNGLEAVSSFTSEDQVSVQEIEVISDSSPGDRIALNIDQSLSTSDYGSIQFAFRLEGMSFGASPEIAVVLRDGLFERKLPIPSTTSENLWHSLSWDLSSGDIRIDGAVSGNTPVDGFTQITSVYLELSDILTSSKVYIADGLLLDPKIQGFAVFNADFKMKDSIGPLSLFEIGIGLQADIENSILYEMESHVKAGFQMFENWNFTINYLPAYRNEDFLQDISLKNQIGSSFTSEFTYEEFSALDTRLIFLNNFNLEEYFSTQFSFSSRGRNSSLILQERLEIGFFNQDISYTDSRVFDRTYTGLVNGIESVSDFFSTPYDIQQISGEIAFDTRKEEEVKDLVALNSRVTSTLLLDHATEIQNLSYSIPVALIFSFTAAEMEYTVSPGYLIEQTMAGRFADEMLMHPQLYKYWALYTPGAMFLPKQLFSSSWEQYQSGSRAFSSTITRVDRVDVSRKPTKDRLDILLPQSLSYRRVQEFSPALEENQRHEIDLNWKATNIFGAFSQQQQFDFYNLDSFSTSIQMSFSDTSIRAELQSGQSFFADDWILSNEFTTSYLSSSDEFEDLGFNDSASLTFSIPMEQSIELYLIEFNRFDHVYFLELGYKGPLKTVAGRYEFKLKNDSLSSITLFGGLAMEFFTEEAGYFAFGFDFGLKGVLQF